MHTTRKTPTILLVFSIGFLTLLLLSSLLYTLDPIFITITNNLWFTSYVIIFLFAGFCIYELIRHLFHRQGILTILFIIFYFALIINNIPLAKNLSGETTIETTCAIKNIQSESGQTCLFGYPDKQYYLASLPTMLFGRALASLHTGGSLYFLLGLVIFSAGVLRFYKYSLKGDALCAIFLASLLHFYYFHYFLFRFEQSIFPLSFGLSVVGITLYYLASSKKILLIPFTFFLVYLAYSYTPSLSLFFLIIGLLFSTFFLDRFKHSEKILFLFIIFIGLFFFLITLGFREDIHVINEHERTYTQLFQDLQQGFTHFFIPNIGKPFVSPYYSFIFITTIILSACFSFGKKAAVFSWWIIGTIFFAIISQGYIYYTVDFRLHRSLVVLPIFFLLLMIIEHKIQFQHKIRYLYGIGIVTFIFGFFFYVQSTQDLQINPHYHFIKFLQSHKNILPLEQKSTLYFVNNTEQYNNLISLNDTSQYFLPTVSLEHLSLYEPCMPALSTPAILVLHQRDPCYNSLMNYQSSIPIGIFVTTDETQLKIFYLPEKNLNNKSEKNY